MSGTIVDNVARASGTIAATPGGLDWSTAVVTGSTVTVEAGRGYFINTTSNACTVTLPSSAEAGDQIIIADYARTWSTNAVTLDSNGLNFQGSPDTYTVEYSTVGQSLNIVYSDSTKGWLPVSDDAVADVPEVPPTQRAIFGYGRLGNNSRTSITNLVNSSGVVASDTAGVGTAKTQVTATNYGGDKAIFGFGNTSNSAASSTGTTNLVNNSGVVGSDVSAVGTASSQKGASPFGVGKAIFGFGNNTSEVNIATTNLVSDQGVVASDTSAVSGATARTAIAAAPFGGDQCVFAYGYPDPDSNLSNKVSNTGVVSSDTSGVGTARVSPGAAGYGTGTGIFAYGEYTNHVNLVSNTGVIASDTTAGGTARSIGAGASYGGDKALFYGGNSESSVALNISNLVNSSGVVGADVTGVGTARRNLAGATYSFSA